MRRLIGVLVVLAGCQAVESPTPEPFQGVTLMFPRGVALPEQVTIDRENLTPIPSDLQPPTPCPVKAGTCAEALATCGSIPDGCGDAISCGSCSAPAVCGAARPSGCDAPDRFFTQLALGRDRTCAVTKHHTLFCWGIYGAAVPTQLGTDSDWSTVALDGALACGIKLDGSLWCFSATSTTPQRVGTESDWTALSGGSETMCGLRAGGSLWCWGRLLTHTWGHSSITPSSSEPVHVETQSTWSSINVGRNTMCAVSTGGAVWCWAHYLVPGPRGLSEVYSPRVQVGPASEWRLAEAGAAIRAGTQLYDVVWAQPKLVENTPSPTDTWIDAASTRSNLCAIRSDRTLWCWAKAAPYSPPVQADERSQWSSVTAGTDHFCGQLEDGTTHCWGSNLNGALGTGTLPQPDVQAPVAPSMRWAAVATAGDLTWAIRTDGTLWGWGSVRHDLTASAPTLFHAGTDWGRFAPPEVLKANGSVMSLEGGSVGPSQIEGSGWSRLVVLPRAWVYGVKEDGSLWRYNAESAACCWGLLYPRVRVGTESNWSDVVSYSGTNCALRRDGSVSCWPGTTDPVGNIAGQWQRICGAGNGLCGITAQGQVQCTSGQFQSVSMPVTARELACSGDALCAIANDGTLWCAGKNTGGRFGVGPIDTTFSSLVQIGTHQDWTAFSLGAQHACGLRGNGAMYCSGSSLGAGNGTRASAWPVPVVEP